MRNVVESEEHSSQLSIVPSGASEVERQESAAVALQPAVHEPHRTEDGRSARGGEAAPSLDLSAP